MKAGIRVHALLLIACISLSILYVNYTFIFFTGNFKKPQQADDMQRGDIGNIDHQELSTKVTLNVHVYFRYGYL